MADEKRTGAANAAAVWCLNNLLNKEFCSPQQRIKFKNALSSVIRKKLNSCSELDEYCTLQITYNEPDEILARILKQLSFTNEIITMENVMVKVYPNEVWINENPQDYGTEENRCYCVYKS